MSALRKQAHVIHRKRLVVKMKIFSRLFLLHVYFLCLLKTKIAEAIANQYMSGKTSYITLKCDINAITGLRYVFGPVYIKVGSKGVFLSWTCLFKLN